MGFLDIFRRKKKNGGEGDEWKYMIYYLHVSDSGRRRWRQLVDVTDKFKENGYLDPDAIEDWPADGIYQLRAINTRTGTRRVFWTVRVENGVVVEYDPDIAESGRRATGQSTPPNVIDLNQIAQMSQYLQNLRETLKQAGVIQDPWEELIKMMEMFNRMKEVQRTLREAFGPEESVDLGDAPWWAKMLMASLNQVARIAPYVNPYPYPPQPYPPQQQPQPQEQISMPKPNDVMLRVKKREVRWPRTVEVEEEARASDAIEEVAEEVVENPEEVKAKGAEVEGGDEE